MAERYDDMSNVEGGVDTQDYSKPLPSTNLNLGQKFMKYTLLIINSIFLIFSIVLMAVGGAAMNGAINALAGQSIPQGIIAVGVFILLLSLLGFISAYKEYRIGLGIYFIFVSIFTIILLAVGIAVYVKRNDASYYLSQGWIASCTLTTSTAPAYNCSTSAVVLNVQNALSCCGLSSSNDMFTANSTTGYQCPQANAQPCLPLMTSTFTNNFSTAGGVGIAFAIIMLVSLLFIGLLMRGIRITRNARQLEQLREKQYHANSGINSQGINLPDNVL